MSSMSLLSVMASRAVRAFAPTRSNG